MVAKLTVFFMIVLFLLAGFVLIIFPWISVGKIGDWGENYFLVSLARFFDLPALQKIIASGWVRGAITGLGVLNLILAFWEIANFKKSTDNLEKRNNQSAK